MDYFKFLYPKGTSAAQDMAICIHLAALDMSLSSGARHRGDTDTENLRRLLSCRYQLEVPPDHVGLFLSVSGTDKIREGPAAAAAKAAVKAAKAVEKAAEAARKEAVKAAKKAAKDPATMTEQQKDAVELKKKEAQAAKMKKQKEARAAAKKAAATMLTEQQKDAVELKKKEAHAALTEQQKGVWLDRATIRFRVFGPSSFNTALQLVLRPHFLVHFV
jgi:DNA polymerase III gamma/tau subunit